MREKGWSTMKNIRTELRHDRSTQPEVILWEQLKGKKLRGLKFRRQHGIAHYVVDFYHPESMTVIELDGAVHNDQQVKMNDLMREDFLRERGYKILRFKNEEVYNDLVSVLDRISSIVTRSCNFPLYKGDRG